MSRIPPDLWVSHGPVSRRSLAIAGAAVFGAPTLWAGTTAQLDRMPSMSALSADGDLVQRAYEALHPGLYRYNTPAQMQRHFDALRRELAEASLQRHWQAGAWLALTRLTAKIRCGHTYANFYNQSDAVQQRLFQGTDRLPCEFRWLDGRMVVTRDLSVEQCLPRGTMITTIANVPAAALLQRLMPLTRADGANDDKRVALLEVQGLEKIETFDVLLGLLMPDLARGIALRAVHPDGSVQRVVMRPLSYAQRLTARRVRPNDERAGWRFDATDADLALLRMPDWALYNSKWDWKAFIADCFAQLAATPRRALVIDLRGNEGGLDVGNEILPYLAARPVEVDVAARRVRYRDVPADLEPFLDTWDPSFRHWGEDARRVDDRFYDLRSNDETAGKATIVPRGPRFAGRVFVLIGPDNSSATFQFAQRVRAAGLGTLVGRPTGGNLRGINGGAFFFLRLPASGLEVDVPLIARFPPGDLPDAGLAPDVRIVETIPDLRDGVDVEMAAVRKLLARSGERQAR